MREIISHSSDEELLERLKQRAYYTAEATELAVDEALERGLIFSEQDLLDEKFRGEALQFSWFPVPQNSAVRLRIYKSIARSLVVCGLIPIVFAFLEMNAGRQQTGRPVLIFGLLWMFGAAQLSKRYRPLAGYGLLLASAVAMAFVILHFELLKSMAPMDIGVAFILFLGIDYGLLYCRKLGENM